MKILNHGQDNDIFPNSRSLSQNTKENPCLPTIKNTYTLAHTCTHTYIFIVFT